MALVNLTLRNGAFPSGTVVSLFQTSVPAASQPRGGPPGTPAATATVAADGSLTFTGVTDDKPYLAYASVNGTDVFASVTATSEIAPPPHFGRFADGQVPQWAAAAGKFIGVAGGIAGTDGTLGGPGGTPLSPTVVSDTRGVAAGDLLLFNGTSFVRLPKGAAGQQIVVRSDGTVGYTDPATIASKAWGAKNDGATDDTAAHQAAVNQAIANGGGGWTVDVGPGTSVITNLTGLNNVTLRGAGRYRTTLKVKAGTSGTILTGVNDATNVTIEELGIDGSAATACHGLSFPWNASGPTDITVQRCYLRNLAGNGSTGGIAVNIGYWAQRVSVLENLITNCGNSAVFAPSSAGVAFTDIVIRGNVISNIFTTAPGTEQGAIQIGSCWSRVTITGNHISTVGTGSANAAAIVCVANSSGSSTSQELVISNNVLYSIGASAIAVHATTATTTVDATVVAGNTAKNCTLTGGNPAVIGVWFYSPATVANITNATIADNTVSGTGVLGYGVELTATGGHVKGNHVTGTSNPGIIAILQGGTIIGNYASCPGGGYGIECLSSSHVTIASNTADSNGYGGIAVGSVDGGTGCDHVTITGNTCTRNGGLSTGQAWQYAGIILKDSTFCTVTGNTSTDNTNASANQSRGIIENGSANNNNFSNNDLRNNQGGPFTLVGAASIARNNTGYNPVGTVSPAVPATGVAVAAVAYDRTFYVTAAAAGCTMAIQGGPSVVIPASALGTVRVPAGQTVTPTFTNAPTWVVEGE